jgi:hypothetical protein
MKLSRFSVLLILASLGSPNTALAQSSWDGVWKGYWHNHRFATIIVKDNTVVDYQSGGDRKRLSATQATDDTLSFGYGRARNTVTLTRTGANSADGMRVTRFNGLIRDARNAKGYNAGSAIASFTRT